MKNVPVMVPTVTAPSTVLNLKAISFGQVEATVTNIAWLSATIPRAMPTLQTKQPKMNIVMLGNHGKNPNIIFHTLTKRIPVINVHFNPT